MFQNLLSKALQGKFGRAHLIFEKKESLYKKDYFIFMEYLLGNLIFALNFNTIFADV